MILSSFLVYTCEGFLSLTLLVGMFVFFRWVSGRRGAVLSRVGRDDLARFCVWQVFFVAGWSVLFKASLPFGFHTSHILSSGGSVYFAFSAEMWGVLACLVGLLWLWWRVMPDREE